MADPVATQVKQTPGRRRPGGANAGRSSNRKNYASENDVSRTDPNFQPDFAHRHNHIAGGGPTTPQKAHKNAVPSKSPAASAQSASGKTTKRANNKNPPKNISTSPAPAKPGRRTPPQTAGPKPTGAPASGPASAAFAGATFHASPAPSSLPLPSFFTKTNSPGTPRARPTSGLSQQPSPPASDTELPPATTTNGTSVPAASSRNPLFPTGGASIPPPRDESPLDILFRADRAEKERNRRASSANIYGAPVGPFSPPVQMQTLADNSNSHTFPRHAPQQQHLQQQQQSARRPGPTLRTSSSGISAAELDGTPGQPMGPAFATPFQERIRAARSTEARGPSGNGESAAFRDLAAGAASTPFAGAQSTQQPATLSSDDRSEALKRFLFSKTGAPASSTSITPTASALATPTRYPGPMGGAPQPTTYGGTPYPSTYSSSSASRTPNRQSYPDNQAQATPNRPNGNGNNIGSGNNGSSNIAAMEDSLRQILKLDSPFGGSTSSPGFHRQP